MRCVEIFEMPPCWDMGGEQRPLERQVPRQSVLASRAILTGTDNLKIVPSLTANLPTCPRGSRWRRAGDALTPDWGKPCAAPPSIMWPSSEKKKSSEVARILGVTRLCGRQQRFFPRFALRRTPKVSNSKAKDSETRSKGSVKVVAVTGQSHWVQCFFC